MKKATAELLDSESRRKIEIERERILTEYARREKDVDPALYDERNLVESWFIEERQAVARNLLRDSGLTPTQSWKVLEVGVGTRGWIPEILNWGVPEQGVSGIELDEKRLRIARNKFPKADLRVGDATNLPWDTESFDVVIASTVFSSIRDPFVRQVVAYDILRVLKIDGAVVWYDMRVGNPSNRNVVGIGKKELQRLFPILELKKICSITLAPPLARRIFPHSTFLARILARLPFMRTHYVGVFKKN